MQVTSNIRVTVAANVSDDFVEFCENNGCACYYVGREGDFKEWELNVNANEALGVAELLTQAAAQFS